MKNKNINNDQIKMLLLFIIIILLVFINLGIFTNRNDFSRRKKHDNQKCLCNKPILSEQTIFSGIVRNVGTNNVVVESSNRKVSFSINDVTTILNEKDENITIDSINIDDYVEVINTGIFLESYPEQGEAIQITLVK